MRFGRSVGKSKLTGTVTDGATLRRIAVNQEVDAFFQKLLDAFNEIIARYLKATATRASS